MITILAYIAQLDLKFRLDVLSVSEDIAFPSSNLTWSALSYSTT